MLLGLLSTQATGSARGYQLFREPTRIGRQTLRQLGNIGADPPRTHPSSTLGSFSGYLKVIVSLHVQLSGTIPPEAPRWIQGEALQRHFATAKRLEFHSTPTPATRLAVLAAAWYDCVVNPPVETALGWQRNCYVGTVHKLLATAITTSPSLRFLPSPFLSSPVLIILFLIVSYSLKYCILPVFGAGHRFPDSHNGSSIPACRAIVRKEQQLQP
jgi:hypothetical protein